MSEDWRSGPGGYRPRLDEQGNPVPRARGSKPIPGNSPGQRPSPTADVIAAARALYEGEPGATCESVAKQIDRPVGTVRRWKAEGDWKPAKRGVQQLSAKAGELANSFKTKMSELGKPMSDEVAAAEVAKELSEQFAVDVRAQLLDRHRKEWAAPRKIAYEAMQKGDLDKAKLAKIAAETLMLIQTGECRAYGLDQAARGADAARTVVVIDRDGATDVQLEQPPLPDEAPAVVAAIERTSAGVVSDGVGDPGSDGEEF